MEDSVLNVKKKKIVWFYCYTCATVSGLCEIVIMASFASVG